MNRYSQRHSQKKIKIAAAKLNKHRMKTEKDAFRVTTSWLVSCTFKHLSLLYQPFITSIYNVYSASSSLLLRSAQNPWHFDSKLCISKYTAYIWSKLKTLQTIV